MESHPSFKTPVTEFSGKETSSSDNFQFLHPANVTGSSKRGQHPEWSTSSCASSRTAAAKGSCSTPYNRRSALMSSSRSKSSATPQCAANSKVVAIVEGRGIARGEIGMACIDLKNPVLLLSQFADTQAYLRLAVQLDVLKPIEVLMPNTVLEVGTNTKLIGRIRELFPDISTVTVQRKYFNETRGLQCLQELCAPDYKSVEIEVSPKYYCLAACAALLKYVEFKQNMTYALNSLKIVYCTSADTTMISNATARSLELVTNELGRVDHCLYAVLNHTLTPGGNRLLRANILQPPCDLHTIHTRLDCIGEVLGNEALFYDLKSVIGKFVDTEHLLSLCVQIPKEENVRNCEQKIANVICLKHALELVKPLRDCLSTCTNPLFQTYHKVLLDERFDILLAKIGVVIHTDARWQKGVLNMHMQKCFAVKPNLNGLLDVARRAYSESVNDVSEMVKQLGEQYNLSLHVGYSAMRNFFIQIPSKLLQPNCDLPPIFLKVNKYKSYITCTTEDLIKLNDRIQESSNEIYVMSDLIINEVLKEIRDQIGCLYNLTEAVSSIDFLLSLAHVCTLSDHVRPQFTETLAVKGGRHPVVEKINGCTFVPNNAFLCEEKNFVVLTGANMSGKSTYLKQVALLQIIAQMGSYVPAEFASFRIADQILTRMGSNSDIEKNCSTFMLQMKEANYILQHATEKSLIIMDELGKGTNYEEGCGIAFAICEDLLKTKAFIFCSTHFIELTRLSSLYPNVENYHFKVDFVMEEVMGCSCNFTYILTPGPYLERGYGIKLAKMSTMPPEVVAKAEKLALSWADSETNTTTDPTPCDENQHKIKLAIHLIQLAKNPSLEEDGLRDHLSQLQLQCMPQQGDTPSQGLSSP